MRPVDKWIEAIRSDKIVGKGTCSIVDETFSDDDLRTHLMKATSNGECSNRLEALTLMRTYHEIWSDMGSPVWGA
tara:strand:+ start:917 stop:1141 length:225 start_codon:yes stop_codon:yes gene_type:complete